MKYNRVLTDEDRKYYEPLIDKMKDILPDMMARKIPEANVQQAFVLETVMDELKEKPLANVLCAGSFEDTAAEYLEPLTNLTKIDPAVNMDLHSYLTNTDKMFDIVFSTSVIEHVKDDEQFLKDICLLLKPGGLGVLTCDFNNEYVPGDKLPATDFRFYTVKDFTKFRKILNKFNCELVDKPNWGGEPDFVFDGCKYSFATFVFRRK